jgi:hypothetical protein
MKTTMKFLAAGLLAGALTFVGCKSDSSAERTGEATQPAPTTGTEGTGTEGTGTEGTGTEGTGTTPTPGTGGSGGASKTKQSDDNLRMPREDPLRTPENESIRDAESEPHVHDNSAVEPGTGGSGLGDDEAATDETLNPGGNVDNTLRTPGSPADVVPEDTMSIDSELPEGAR